MKKMIVLLFALSLSVSFSQDKTMKDFNQMIEISSDGLGWSRSAGEIEVEGTKEADLTASEFKVNYHAG
jgi:hypothetical protein